MELNETLPIYEVTKEAFNALGQNGVIHAANGHTYPECSQLYRPLESENSDLDDMEIDHADVTMHVVDGIVMGPTHCAFNNCESELINACGGSFCAIHEGTYGSKCHVVGCYNDKLHPHQEKGKFLFSILRHLLILSNAFGGFFYFYVLSKISKSSYK